MKEREAIYLIYDALRLAYNPIAEPIMQGIFDGTIVLPTGVDVFPPKKGVAINAQKVEAGFLKHDCAILTAFRANRSEDINRAINEQLQRDMEELRLNHISVDGCYREAREAEASVEDSFFVYDDGSHNPQEFFTKVYQLSEKYEQDCFLYKAAGINRVAFLISTNDDARAEMGDFKLAGSLYLDLEPVGPYTIIGYTCVRFEENEPN